MTTDENPNASAQSPKVQANHKYEALAADQRDALLQRNIGVIVEHGRANYNFEKDTPQNYYVKLSGADNKTKTVWGADLERAIAESQSKTGDVVSLERNGKMQVTVDEPVRNDAGQIVSYEKKEATRNSWQAKQPDLERSFAKEANSISTKAVESKAKDTPQGTIEPKSLSEQALDAIRNSKRAKNLGHEELADKHNKNAIALAYQSGKSGEDTGRLKKATHPELIASHTRGAESNEIRDRAAKTREAEKNLESQKLRDKPQPQQNSFQQPTPDTKPALKIAAPKGLEQSSNFAERQGEANPDKDRQNRILQQINREYSGSGGKYYQNDARGNQRLAFRDSGAKIVAQNNDQKVAFAVAAMAEAKGWSEVKVSGHADFRRNVWLEAKSRGLDVRGYTPNEQDQAALQERLDAKQREAKASSKSTAKDERAGGTVEPVVKAVADAVVKSQVRNPSTQKKILDVITQRLQGKKFTVPAYDLKAHPKAAHEVEKSASRAPNTERTR